jgi:hypothetical protein
MVGVAVRGDYVLDGAFRNVRRDFLRDTGTVAVIARINEDFCVIVVDEDRECLAHIPDVYGDSPGYGSGIWPLIERAGHKDDCRNNKHGDYGNNCWTAESIHFPLVCGFGEMTYHS